MKIIMVSILLFILGCMEETWTGFVYPDKNDLSIYKSIGTFKTLKQCRSASLSSIDRYKGDFECGLNCRGSVCDKTRK